MRRSAVTLLLPSAKPDWPSANYTSERKAALLLAVARVIPADRLDVFVERQLIQTLQVGTYEAAIEIMLCRRNLDAIRYLNVRESAGSLSLAVLPETIAHMQTVGLPGAPLWPPLM